jgi:hypothetical protein
MPQHRADREKLEGNVPFSRNGSYGYHEVSVPVYDFLM